MTYEEAKKVKKNDTVMIKDTRKIITVLDKYDDTEAETVILMFKTNRGHGWVNNMHVATV